MSFTQTYVETFHVVSCYTCGVNFGINDELHRRAVKHKKGSVYCPACGKGTRWMGESEAERLQRAPNTAKRRADNLERDLEKSERSLTATKGVVTKLKNRASKGLCPCCNRHFADLHRHMNRMHPRFESED